jgi:hypothetical protein
MISMVSKEGGWGECMPQHLVQTLASKGGERGLPKMKTTSTFPICNLFHLCMETVEI